MNRGWIFFSTRSLHHTGMFLKAAHQSKHKHIKWYKVNRGEVGPSEQLFETLSANCTAQPTTGAEKVEVSQVHLA